VGFASCRPSDALVCFFSLKYPGFLCTVDHRLATDVVESESGADKDGEGGGLEGEGTDTPGSQGVVAASVGAGQTVDTGPHQWHQDLHHDQDTGSVVCFTYSFIPTNTH